jgi:hypothetical protein
MVTAAGFSAPATCAAIRAGVSGVRVDNLWDPKAGAFMSVGRPRTPQWWEGPDMLAELAAAAIVECIDGGSTPPEQVPVFTMLPPSTRPLRDPELERIVADELQRRLPHSMQAESKVFSEGRTSIGSALVQAHELLSSGKARCCVVVGVETFLRQKIADQYIQKRRLLVEGNSNGFIPGEAACAVMLATAGATRHGELRIIGLGTGHETGGIETDQPLTGDGLTEALREALDRAGIGMADTDYWLTDQNGEHYKFKEATVAQIRLERRERPAARRYESWHPIEYLGEIGTAIGPCLLGLALAAHRGGYAPGLRSVLHVGEDDGGRAAMVLEWSGGE